MDPWSARAANRLVGNPDDAAVIECTLQGPELRAVRDTWLAIAGAAFTATVDGIPVPLGNPFLLQEGSVLTLSKAMTGARCYLAVAGGICVDEVMGSRSTFMRGGWGGFEGRRLLAGDALSIGSLARASGTAPSQGQRIPAWVPNGQDEEIVLRALPGPQWEAFSADSQERFFAEAFRVSPQSDRMGIRLLAEPLRHLVGAEIPPEGAVPGAVQVPGDGQAIILGVDQPVTGGYAKIATIIAADWGRLAYAMPGAKLRFQRCEVEQALIAYGARRVELTEFAGAPWPSI